MGAALFILAIALLWQRRPAALPGLLFWQVMALATASGVQLWQAGSVWWEIATTVVALMAYGAAIPLAAGRLAMATTADESRSAVILVLAGLLAGIAVLVANALAPLPWRANFAVALAVGFLGLLTLAVRQTTAAQVAGLLCLLNGVLFGAITAIVPLRG